MYPFLNCRNYPTGKKVAGANGRKVPTVAVAYKDPKELESDDDSARIEIVGQRGIARGCITMCKDEKLCKKKRRAIDEFATLKYSLLRKII